MLHFLGSVSRRDATLVVIGAVLMYILTVTASLADLQSVTTIAEFYLQANGEASIKSPVNDQNVGTPEPCGGSAGKSTTFRNVALSTQAVLPETTIVEHVPGWTLFRDIYMANGTLLILTSSPSSFPPARYMTSTGLPAVNTPENIALREPTPWNMDFVSPEEAIRRWGDHASTRNVLSVEGNTFLFNDPSQFLAHYYHFCAELLFGTWSFWTGAAHPEPPPPIHRVIFSHSSSDGWRDHPGLNGYFLRAAFPSLTVEVEADWNDRIISTSDDVDSGVSRAWHFPYLLLADRSAAFRGTLCGSENQRTASESVDSLIARSKLDKSGLWWKYVRQAVWRFAGVTVNGDTAALGNHVLDNEPLASSPSDFEETQKIVITYISRQSSRRRLIPEDHEALVKNLEDLVRRKNAEITSTVHTGGIAGKEWELNVVRAQDMTKDEQIQLVARTTILLGVHGNGLTHLILLPRTNVSAVIEIFYPGGFAHDYEWTARTLGLGYFGVWNETYFTERNIPPVGYPEGFQGERIPVHGPNVASMIEKRISGEL